MKQHPNGLTSMAIVGIVLAIIILAGAVYYGVSVINNTNNANTNTSDEAMTEENNTNQDVMNNDEAMKDDSMTEDKNTNEAMEAEDAMMEDKNTNEAMEDDTQASASSPGEYKEYSSASFAEASGKQRVLFFYAAWCPTCRPADANITANESSLPDDVVVFRANYDTEDELKAKYGVTYQHTFVLVDENGNALKKWNGGDIDEIIANVS